jgi:hypothetical protein
VSPVIDDNGDVLFVGAAALFAATQFDRAVRSNATRDELLGAVGWGIAAGKSQAIQSREFDDA